MAQVFGDIPCGQYNDLESQGYGASAEVMLAMFPWNNPGPP